MQNQDRPNITDKTERLLERSEEFESALITHFPNDSFLAETTLKNELCATACFISIEHACVLRAAFKIYAPNTGAMLLRPQFEALLRAAWLLFAANTSQQERLANNLSLEAEQNAKNLPSYLEMLDAVCKHAPHGLSAPLVEFNQYSRHALNSFVHCGIHPLRRAKDGFPEDLQINVVLMSNGLLHFAYRMIAALTGSEHRMREVTHLYKQFEDCLPIIKISSKENNHEI
jgi:hypothetical protein